MKKFEEFLVESKKSGKKLNFKDSGNLKKFKNEFDKKFKNVKGKKQNLSTLTKTNRKIKRYSDDLSKVFDTELVEIESLYGLGFEVCDVELTVTLKANKVLDTKKQLVKFSKENQTWSFTVHVKAYPHYDEDYGADFKFDNFKFSDVIINQSHNVEILKNGKFIEPKFNTVIENTVKEIIEEQWLENFDELAEKHFQD